jgi:hypothetical protein
MNSFRFRLRVFLIAFALGLVVTSAHARLSKYFDEIPVDLPVVNSESPIIVQPQSDRFPLILGGGWGGGKEGINARRMNRSLFKFPIPGCRRQNRSHMSHNFSR